MENEPDGVLEGKKKKTELTFIVHARNPLAPSPTDDPRAFLQAHNDESTMLGDVNLFLHSEEEEEEEGSEPDDDEGERSRRRDSRVAELEIMLPPRPTSPSPSSSSSASTSTHRPRTGIAFETLRTFMTYARGALDLDRGAFIVKIGYDNEPSLSLFRKLGFVETKRVDVFREVEMRYPRSSMTTSRSKEFEWERDVAVGVLQDPRDPLRD